MDGPYQKLKEILTRYSRVPLTPSKDRLISKIWKVSDIKQMEMSSLSIYRDFHDVVCIYYIFGTVKIFIGVIQKKNSSIIGSEMPRGMSMLVEFSWLHWREWALPRDLRQSIVGRENW